MAESRCACCDFLDAPSARVNFIILTGLPESPVRTRIRQLLTHGTELISRSNIEDLTDYKLLEDRRTELFGQTSSSTVSSSILRSPEVQKCCHGSQNILVPAIDSVDLIKWDVFKEQILDQVKSKPTSVDTKDGREAPTWVIFDDSSCLERRFLDIFLQIDNTNHGGLLDFTFTVLCVLGNERECFENCVLQRITIDDYEFTIYPTYKRRIHDFFLLLHSSPTLRNQTVLVEQKKLSSDEELSELLRNLTHYKPIKLNIIQKLQNSYVTTLPSFYKHTIQDVLTIQSDIRKRFDSSAEEHLALLHSKLQGANLDENVVYEIARLVFIDFEYMETEKLTIYKKKLIRGFNGDDSRNSNTIAARLIHHGLELIRIQKLESTIVSLIYSIVSIICSLGRNITFRHDLFDYNPEIYRLSMELISQREYALVLAGLKLCTTILDGDLIEHKYANEYLKHDPHPARRMMDAIKWLLTPYQTVQTHWRQELTSTSLERQCYIHTAILADQEHLQGLTFLLCGSLHQCLEMTIDDVRVLVESIDILADRRLSHDKRADERHFSFILISNLCSILIPILQYSSPDVSLALRRESLLLKVIPKAIRILSSGDAEAISPCFRFYSILLQMRWKDFKLHRVYETEKSPIAAIEEPPSNTTVPLKFTRNLIVSYFEMNRKYSKFIFSAENSPQNKARELLDIEWKKFDNSQLEYEHKQLTEQYISLQNTNKEMKKTFQWIESEYNRLQIENTQLLKEIDSRKVTTTNNTTADIPLSSNIDCTTKNIQNDIIEELRDTFPDEITEEQAKIFVEEIHRRRMAFNDKDMRESICGSLKHLGSDLYTSSVHFLHELIQNAEDNSYDEKSTPTLRIILNRESILLSNNEKGLHPRDVLAICSLAVTTKKLDQHIGEKGVGFKSVFAASDRPTLISRAWKFAFHVSNDAMSYITPIWLSNEDIPDQIRLRIEGNKLDTHLYLPVKSRSNMETVDTFLDQVNQAVDPCVLLTLSKLQKLEIIDERVDKKTIYEKQILSSTAPKEITFEELTFSNLKGSEIQLSTSTEQNHFKVYTRARKWMLDTRVLSIKERYTLSSESLSVSGGIKISSSWGH